MTVNNIKRRVALLTAVFALTLCAGAGLTGCKDLFHPEGSSECTVTFDGNGGTPTTQTKTVDKGTSIGTSDMPTRPTRSGYTFDDWYTSTSGNTKFTFLTIVREDITVYARWTSSTSTQYTVTFDGNGGTPAKQTKTVSSGSSIGSYSMPSDPTRSGYTFGGWYTSTSGGTQFTYSKTVTTNITVYARWTANTATQRTVTFDGNGGTPAKQTRTVSSGSSIGTSNMPTNPTRSGYTFGGWNTLDQGYLEGKLVSIETVFTAYTPVTENITVYAKWTANTVTQYTVTFSGNGGTPATQTRTVSSGDWLGTSNMPSDPTRGGYTFGGWYYGSTFTAYTMVTANITVYAVWTPGSVVPGTTLQGALDWLDSNAEDGGNYTITLSANESIGPKTLSYSGKKVSISIIGGSSERTISLSSNGALFGVESGVTLILGNNVTLRGWSSNTLELVQVGSGGTLIMETGSKITGNTAFDEKYNVAGGVFLFSGGTFTMNGGTISGNSASVGDEDMLAAGGVYVSSGVFTMNGGEISGNTSYYAGGVCVGGGTFTKSGGTIYGSNASSSLKNTATAGSSYGYAVFVNSSPTKKRNSTAGEGVTLDSATSGSAGGWE